MSQTPNSDPFPALDPQESRRRAEIEAKPLVLLPPQAFEAMGLKGYPSSEEQRANVQPGETIATEQDTATEDASQQKFEVAVIDDATVAEAVSQQLGELDGFLRSNSRVGAGARDDGYHVSVSDGNERISTHSANLDIVGLSSGQPAAELRDNSYGHTGATRLRSIEFNAPTNDGGRRFAEYSRNDQANGSSRSYETTIVVNANGTLTAVRKIDGYNARTDVSTYDEQNIPADQVAGYVESMSRAVQDAVETYRPVAMN